MDQFNYKGRGRERGQYILDGHRPVPCDDLLEWGKFFESADRIVKSDMVKGVHVSTVFLGLDHSFGYGPPILFETMIFGGPMDMYQERYRSWEGAVCGHDKALKKCIRVMNRQGRRKMAMATTKLWTYVDAEGAFAGKVSPKSQAHRLNPIDSSRF
jgi:hypothetical protein